MESRPETKARKEYRPEPDRDYAVQVVSGWRKVNGKDLAAFAQEHFHEIRQIDFWMDVKIDPLGIYLMRMPRGETYPRLGGQIAPDPTPDLLQYEPWEPEAGRDYCLQIGLPSQPDVQYLRIKGADLAAAYAERPAATHLIPWTDHEARLQLWADREAQKQQAQEASEQERRRLEQRREDFRQQVMRSIPHEVDALLNDEQRLILTDWTWRLMGADKLFEPRPQARDFVKKLMKGL
jgi:hypothetical protein